MTKAQEIIERCKIAQKHIKQHDKHQVNINRIIKSYEKV